MADSDLTAETKNGVYQSKIELGSLIRTFSLSADAEMRTGRMSIRYEIKVNGDSKTFASLGVVSRKLFFVYLQNAALSVPVNNDPELAETSILDYRRELNKGNLDDKIDLPRELLLWEIDQLWTVVSGFYNYKGHMIHHNETARILSLTSIINRYRPGQEIKKEETEYVLELKPIIMLSL